MTVKNRKGGGVVKKKGGVRPGIGGIGCDFLSQRNPQKNIGSKRGGRGGEVRHQMAGGKSTKGGGPAAVVGVFEWSPEERGQKLRVMKEATREKYGQDQEKLTRIERRGNH